MLKDASGQPLLKRAQYQAGLALFEQHLQIGAIGFLEIDYDEVFNAAADISKRHGVNRLVRTADLMHVAMMEFGFDHFVTADRQQHDFAQTVGYTAIFLPP